MTTDTPKYDHFIQTPELAVERQRAWVAFMAAVAYQYASAVQAAEHADSLLAEWDKRFGPQVREKRSLA